MSQLKEGRVQVVCGEGRAIVAALLCQTDFLAKSEKFSEFLDDICSAKLREKKIDSILDELRDISGEQIEARYTIIDIPEEPTSPTAFYIHHDNKKVGLVQLQIQESEPAWRVLELAHDIAMHVVALTPHYISLEDVNWDEVELELTPELMDGKTEFVQNKIIEGKKKKYAEENVLLEQTFIKDKDKKISDLIDEFNKEHKVNVSINDFVYLSI